MRNKMCHQYEYREQNTWKYKLQSLAQSMQLNKNTSIFKNTMKLPQLQQLIQYKRYPVETYDNIKVTKIKGRNASFRSISKGMMLNIMIS